MASLSRIVKNKDVVATPKREIKRKLKPTTIPEVRIDNYDADFDTPLEDWKNDTELAEEVADIECPEEFQHCLFLADTSLSAKIKDQLAEYSNIRSYESKTFTNRSLQQLLLMDVNHIWVDIRSQKAREWVGQYLLKNNGTYTAICVYTKKRSKYIIDLEPHVTLTTHIKHLNRLKSLNSNDFGDQLKNFLKIHAPASPIMSCLGLSGKLTKKQQSN